MKEYAPSLVDRGVRLDVLVALTSNVTVMPCPFCKLNAHIYQRYVAVFEVLCECAHCRREWKQ